MTSLRMLLFLCMVSARNGLASPGAVRSSATEAGSVGSGVAQIPRILSLTEAKRMAFDRNWDLLAAKSDVDVATAAKIIAHDFPNPTLAISTAKIGVDGGSGTSLGNSLWDRSYDTIAAVNQLFEIDDKRASRQSSARAGFAAATARFQDARRVLDLAVSRTYIAALLAEANRQVLQNSASALRQETTIANRRLQAGDISAADQSQIEIAADRL